MKKNFWSCLAVLLAALFVGVTAVQAADISFSGQLLERATYQDTDEDADAPDWNVAQRMRFNTTVKGSGLTAFTQFDHVHTWGTNVGPGTDANGVAANEGVGVHQAYLEMPNLYGSGWNAKLGRQEIVLDGHRIFGHTGWNLHAVTFDAAVLNNPEWDLLYALSWAANSGQAGTNADNIQHIFRKGLNLAGGKTALYWVIVDDGTDVRARAVWHTLGIRQVGKLAGGYDYRVEYYHQTGEVVPSVTDEGGTGTWVANSESDVDAFMWGARIGKKVDKTKVTLWYDYASGNDDAAATANNWESWNQLHDTGHKFYGLIDKVAPGGNVDHLGLQDFAVKIVHPVQPGWTFKADYHNFWTAVDPGDNLTAWAGDDANASAGSHLGDELDLTLKHKYNGNASVQFGYSWFNGSDTWMNIDDDASAEDSHWAYTQVNFTY